jgi:hypothetical protein
MYLPASDMRFLQAHDVVECKCRRYETVQHTEYEEVEFRNPASLRRKNENGFIVEFS